MRRLAIALLVLLCNLGLPSATGQVAGRNFDHLTTGFELTGAHRLQACESCHVNAVFKGTPRDCFSCHSPGSRIDATPKPATHIVSGEACVACHSTAVWTPAVRFDHEQAKGSCASCHNDVQAPGKPPGHVQTAMDCSACHGSRAWSPAKFDHASVTGSCVTCHDGGRATGRGPQHLSTSNSCESCHTYGGWSPVQNVDHAEVVGTCASCHDGTRAAEGPAPGDGHPGAAVAPVQGEQPQISGVKLGVPGFAVLFIFLTAQITARSIYDEKRTGTFRRLLASPLGKWPMLIGKLIPNFVVVLVQVVVLFAAGMFLLPLMGLPALQLGNDIPALVRTARALQRYPVVGIDLNLGCPAPGVYRKWAGGGLPSEAQSEMAARGTDGRLYPWGNAAPDTTRLNYINLKAGRAEAGHTKGCSWSLFVATQSQQINSTPHLDRRLRQHAEHFRHPPQHLRHLRIEVGEQPGARSGMVTSLARRTAEQGIAGDWGPRATRIIDGPLARALDAQIKLVEEQRRRATHDAGIRRRPGGEAYYGLCLRFQTSTRMTPDEAHALGLAQVAEISAAADELLDAQGFSDGSVGARLAALTRDPQWLYANTDAGRAQLLADLNTQVVAMQRRMPELFGVLPKTPVEVRRVPPEIELGAPRGYAQSGSLDGTRPGAYYINLAERASGRSGRCPR